MNELHKLIIDDIETGEGLPWDVMDSYGRLLLKQGSVIDNLAHAKEMVERGMYIEKGLYTKLPAFDRVSSAAHPAKEEAAAQLKGESPSVLYNINMAVKRLDVLLKNIHKFPDARGGILDVVKLIRLAIHLSEDLALASIQLNHESGSYCVRHCVDTAILAMIIAESMKKSPQEIQDIGAAALTMNISMIELQEKLQVKKEALSDADRAAIHNHPISSIETLYEAGIEDSDWLMYVLLHHEHEDGTGYPVGNVKGEIPQNAKIISLADGFCARISSRGYRKSTLPSVALRDIFIENKAQVDATLASYFIKVLGLYPPGTFVNLKNKEIAIISHRGADHNSSKVYSLVKPNGELFAAPIRRDTSVDAYKIAEAIYPVEADVHVNLQQIWGPLAST
jgi:HD-GYP domain-containing protein (c-di-GMP phosphodiesterase class II)